MLIRLRNQGEMGLATDSYLGDSLKRTCENLRRGATKQIADYDTRFSVLRSLYDDLLANLIVAGYEKEKAWETAIEFFDSDTVRFAAVDGTMYSRPLFDIIIFFGGAYAATGSLTFVQTGVPRVEYDAKTMRQSTGLSSVIPIYVNEIPEVDHTFAAQEQPSEVSPSKSLTNEEIANNSLIANTMMTFCEYYLAYKLATDPMEQFHALLMDRSLSTERSRLLYETRKTDFWQAKCAIVGAEVDGRKIDGNDLSMARQHVRCKSLGLPPPRADYLRNAILALLEIKGQLTIEEIQSTLQIEEEKRKKRIQSAVDSLLSKQIVTEKGGAYSLDPRYFGSWERMKKLTVEIGERLFFSKTTNGENSCFINIVKDGKEYWLTTLDISFLTLFTLNMLIEECWRRRILLVGITKDTSARDFKVQLIPVMHNEGLLETEIRLDLQKLPNTDRMILQSVSMLNAEDIEPPWSLIEYDSAFRTIHPDAERGKGYVSGAIRNKIGLEKTFLKTYVQLSQAKSDLMLRSNVLLIDRLVYPEFDCCPESRMQLRNVLSDGTEEPVETLLFRNNCTLNRIQNLVMAMLLAMAPSNIPEAFGHNKPLFIADKIAKWNYTQFKYVVDSTAGWILNNHKLRKFVFYMSTFRERRNQIEQTRRDNA